MRLIRCTLLVAHFIAQIVVLAEQPQIISFDNTGMLSWSNVQSHAYCGIESAENLNSQWSAAPAPLWNIPITSAISSASIPLSDIEGSRLFLRIVSSESELTPQEIYDIDAKGIPSFVSEDYIQIENIAAVSRFRSGVGHDYSDDFESCRSMKHYFKPRDDVDWTNIEISSPVAGTITDLIEEWAGTLIYIKPDQYPAFSIRVFHVAVTNDLSVGDSLVAGQTIGYHIGDQTMSDIAVGVNTPSGWKLLSYFDVMKDCVFSNYQGRGVASRADFIITEEERDQDPLPCDNGEFLDDGNITNWVDFQGSIHGVVTDASYSPLADIAVASFISTEFGWEHAQDAGTNIDGEYLLEQLPPGTYRVKFMDFSGTFAEQYYDGASDFDSATDIQIEPGVSIENINVVLQQQ